MELLLSDIIKENEGRICKVDPEVTIEEAAKLMMAERVGALLVMNEEWVIGVLTERDIVYRVINPWVSIIVIKLIANDPT